MCQLNTYFLTSGVVQRNRWPVVTKMNEVRDACSQRLSRHDESHEARRHAIEKLRSCLAAGILKCPSGHPPSFREFENRVVYAERSPSTHMTIRDNGEATISSA